MGLIPPGELVTATQAARILGISRQAVQDRMARKTLPVVLVPGGGRRIPAAKLVPGKTSPGGRPKKTTEPKPKKRK